MSRQFQDTQFHIPLPRPGAIERPRLLARLDEGMQPGMRLILVSGPAGYGKTSLISQWIQARRDGMNVAWIGLGPGDDDPAAFWACLVHALKPILPVACYQACQAALGLAPGAPETSSPDLVAMLLNGLGDATVPAVLVLDDYQFVQAPAVHAIVTDMLGGLPAQARLLVVTRVDPPLGLARLRARNQLCEIRMADLRFSQQEAAEFLNGLMALQLSDGDVATLTARTEGWAAGLHLAALSLQQHADRGRFVREFSGSHRFILEYLLEEVLDLQPPATQAFLLRTAGLDRMCSDLCDDVMRGVAGSDDSQAVLEALERRNLFVVSLDDEHRWYRYHHLFSDLLRGRMKQALAASELLDLHRRAAWWYERHGLLVEAIQSALSAPDYAGAVELMERHVLTFYYRSEIPQVHRWLAALPEPQLRERPLLAAVYAAAISLTPPYPPSSLAAAEPWLQTAERAMAMEGRGHELARAFSLMLRSYWARFRGEPASAVIDLARRALAILPPESPSGQPPVEADGRGVNFQRIRSALYTNLGFAHWDAGHEADAFEVWEQARRIGLACGDLFNASAVAYAMARALVWRGRLDEVARLCREMLDQLALPGDRRLMAPFGGNLGVKLAEVLLEWNRLDEAEPILRESVELADWTVGHDIHRDGWLALAHLALARGAVDEALTCVDKAERVSSSAAHLAAPYRVRCWLSTGRQDVYGLVRQWASRCGLSESVDPRGPDRLFSDLRASLALARFVLAEVEAGRGMPSRIAALGDLAAWIERQIRAMHAGQWNHWLIQLLVLDSMVRQARGDSTGARDALRQAVCLAAPGGYVRTFSEEGKQLHALLVQLRGDPQVPAPYLERLLAVFQPVATPTGAAAGLVEPLTPREVEVLRMICEGCSNQEIAARLFVSLNTVKKHTHSIFGKLGVANRAQAIVRAQQSGLTAA